MYTIYINNTLPPALAVHEIYRDIFGPPMVSCNKKSSGNITNTVELLRYTIRGMFADACSFESSRVKSARTHFYDLIPEIMNDPSYLWNLSLIVHEWQKYLQFSLV